MSDAAAEVDDLLAALLAECRPLWRLTSEKQVQLVSSLRRNLITSSNVGGSRIEILRRAKTETRRGPLCHAAADELGETVYHELATRIMDRLHGATQ